MRKRHELANPTSCINKAKDDEMVFVLLGRDQAAPAAIRAWVQERIRLGKNQRGDPQIVEAVACAREMEDNARGIAGCPDCMRGTVKKGDYPCDLCDGYGTVSLEVARACNFESCSRGRDGKPDVVREILSRVSELAGYLDHFDPSETGQKVAHILQAGVNNCEAEIARREGRPRRPRVLVVPSPEVLACPRCKGYGGYAVYDPSAEGSQPEVAVVTCEECDGTGRVQAKPIRIVVKPDDRCECGHTADQHFDRLDGIKGSCLRMIGDGKTVCPCTDFQLKTISERSHS